MQLKLSIYCNLLNYKLQQKIFLYPSILIKYTTYKSKYYIGYSNKLFKTHVDNVIPTSQSANINKTSTQHAKKLLSFNTPFTKKLINSFTHTLQNP